MRKKTQNRAPAHDLEIVRDETLPELGELTREVLAARSEERAPVHPHPEEPGVMRDPLPVIKSWPVPEAAVIKGQAEGEETLYVRYSTRELGSKPEWRAVVKFYPASLGSHKVIKVRRVVSQLITTANTIAALERAHGRELQEGSLDVKAEAVELEDAVVKINPKNGSWLPMVRYRNEWIGLCKPLPRATFHAEKQDDRERARRRAQGFPDIAYI